MLGSGFGVDPEALEPAFGDSHGRSFCCVIFQTGPSVTEVKRPVISGRRPRAAARRFSPNSLCGLELRSSVADRGTTGGLGVVAGENPRFHKLPQCDRFTPWNVHSPLDMDRHKV